MPVAATKALTLPWRGSKLSCAVLPPMARAVHGVESQWKLPEIGLFFSN
jgi:hypothetical protein